MLARAGSVGLMCYVCWFCSCSVFVGPVLVLFVGLGHICYSGSWVLFSICCFSLHFRFGLRVCVLFVGSRRSRSTTKTTKYWSTSKTCPIWAISWASRLLPSVDGITGPGQGPPESHIYIYTPYTGVKFVIYIYIIHCEHYICTLYMHSICIQHIYMSDIYIYYI